MHLFLSPDATREGNRRPSAFPEVISGENSPLPYPSGARPSIGAKLGLKQHFYSPLHGALRRPSQKPDKQRDLKESKNDLP